MFYAHYRRNRKAQDSGKFHSQLHQSSPKLKCKSYRDWLYQISFRKTGLTKRRTVFCVTIWSPDSTKKHYIANLRTFETAQSQAIAWIDQALQKQQSTATNREKRIKHVVSKIRHRIDQEE